MHRRWRKYLLGFSFLCHLFKQFFGHSEIFLTNVSMWTFHLLLSYQNFNTIRIDHKNLSPATDSKYNIWCKNTLIQESVQFHQFCYTCITDNKVSMPYFHLCCCMRDNLSHGYSVKKWSFLHLNFASCALYKLVIFSCFQQRTECPLDKREKDTHQPHRLHHGEKPAFSSFCFVK